MGFELDKKDVLQIKVLDKDRHLELFKSESAGADHISFYTLKIKENYFRIWVEEAFNKYDADPEKIQWLIKVVYTPDSYNHKSSEILTLAKETLEAYKNLIYKGTSSRIVIELNKPEVLFSPISRVSSLKKDTL